jgi:ribosomal protein L40E
MHQPIIDAVRGTGTRRARIAGVLESMRKTCPRCGRRTGHRAAYCRGCRYRYPEQASPKPAGLAMGAGFPLFVTGTLILLVGDLSALVTVAGAVMVVVGAVLFFDPR